VIPKDRPPKSSVYDYYDLWTYDGTLERIHYALYEQCRNRAQRKTSPTAAIIDSQSVKSAKKGACIDPHRYDAGKKRHILVDTLGLLLHAIVHPADIQYRDGGAPAMTILLGMFPLLKTLFADSRYQNSAPEQATPATNDGGELHQFSVLRYNVATLYFMGSVVIQSKDFASFS
jgi:transposase